MLEPWQMRWVGPLAGAALALGIFAVDVALPLGVAAAVPYVGVVLLTLWTPRGRDAVLAASACSALTVIGYLLSTDDGMFWVGAANRALALLAIWVTALAVLSRKRALGSEERLRAFVENAAEGIVTFDEDGAIEALNPAAERMFGWAAAEALGRDVAVLAGARGHLAQISEGVRRDGTRFPLEANVVGYELAGKRKRTAILRDLTERRELERQLLHAQKMEAVGTLAAGIAHDFNNLLMAILSCCRTLEREVGFESPALGYLREIREAVESGTSRTRRLLDITRRHETTPGPVDLDGVITGAEAMLRQLLGAEVTLHLDLGTCCQNVVADRWQVEHMLLNLASNSRDAMPAGGAVSIRTRLEELSTAEARQRGLARGGPYVHLAFRDEGCGMDAEVLARAFEPFFTTKGVAAGTGLGLSTVYGLVHGFGGAVELESAEGAGTTVHVRLPLREVPPVAQACSPRAPAAQVGGAPPGAPRANGEAARAGAAGPAGPAGAAGAAGAAADGGRSRDAAEPADPAVATAAPARTVLLVEDERLVRVGLRVLLRRLGYDVLDAASAEEAIALCEQNGRRIDLLLTDVVMPGMSGPELVREIRERVPGMRALVMSAFPQRVLAEQGRIEPGQTTLEKPFSEESLAAHLRAAFGA